MQTRSMGILGKVVAMKISTKGRYALRLMVDLALNYNEEQFVSLKDIAARQRISLKYLEQISVQLSKDGLLIGQRGVGGGYKLALAPNQYTVGSILRAAQGPLAPVGCMEESKNVCTECVNCTSLPFWQGMSQAVNEYADRYTLEDFAKEPESANLL